MSEPNQPLYVATAGFTWMSAARTLTTGTPAFTGTAMDFAVLYADVILASRN